MKIISHEKRHGRSEEQTDHGTGFPIRKVEDDRPGWRAGRKRMRERSAEEAIRRALFPKPVTAIPSSRRLRLFPPGQIEEPHPERLPLDLDQVLPHRAPDGLPGASSDNLPGDAIAR